MLVINVVVYDCVLGKRGLTDTIVSLCMMIVIHFSDMSDAAIQHCFVCSNVFIVAYINRPISLYIYYILKSFF